MATRVADRLRAWFRPQVAYEPLNEDLQASQQSLRSKTTPFSWTYYAIFLLLGVAMLWAW